MVILHFDYCFTFLVTFLITIFLNNYLNQLKHFHFKRPKNILKSSRRMAISSTFFRCLPVSEVGYFLIKQENKSHKWKISEMPALIMIPCFCSWSVNCLHIFCSRPAFQSSGMLTLLSLFTFLKVFHQFFYLMTLNFGHPWYNKSNTLVVFR